MSGIHRTAFLFTFLVIAVFMYGQGPRSWQDHLSLDKCNSVTKLGNDIYASYYNGLVYFDYQELATSRLNKINGLSDVGIRLVRTNPYNNKMIVVYENSNLDIVDINRNVINYPALKLKTMSAKKVINEITFDKNLAYLACGFGIVVFDTERLEIRETYYIGPDGGNLEVLQVALSSDKIYAATPEGLYSVDRSSSLLNFNNWSPVQPGLSKGYYCGVVNAGGTLLCARDMYIPDTLTGNDSLFRLENGEWKHLPPPHGAGYTILKFGNVQGTRVGLLTDAPFLVFDAVTGALEIQLFGVNGKFDYGTLRDCYFFQANNTTTNYWVADIKYGLSRALTSWDPQLMVTTNGMYNRFVSNIDILDGRVAVSTSYVLMEGISPYTSEGVDIYADQQWTHIPIKSPEGNNLIDINSVVFDRFDKSSFWVTSFGYGVVQYKNNKPVRSWTPFNAGLDTNDVGMSKYGAITQDSQGNIWFTNSELRKMLGVIRKSDGAYLSYEFPFGKFARRITIDKNGVIWLPHERDGGITVFRHKNFGSQEFRTLGPNVNEGNLGTNAVYCVTEDLDGRIWVGTGAGIRVFYNPADIFKPGSNTDAQPIKIVQDGNVELLLGAETVTDIQVDGANNKWVGTLGGGLYCFSPDGMRQIYHFTKENSPLYSNSILDLNYDEITGDLYIGSEQGLQTFRSTVISGADDFSTLHAFPNPVRPGYTGTVLLRGLRDNSIVKVTDIAGNIVWEARSTGGQVEWPITNFSGSRVSAGVYLVYASTVTAEMRNLTKILVMN